MVSQSMTRRLLGHAVMASMVAVMAGWLLLDSRRFGTAALAGAAWMVALAVPAAFLQERADPSWESLLNSAARRHRTIFHAVPSGSPMNVAIRHAFVIGWPGFVATAVGAGGLSGSWPGLCVTVSIASVAAVVGWVDQVCARCGGSPETANGLTLALAAMSLLMASSWGWLPSFPAPPAM